VTPERFALMPPATMTARVALNGEDRSGASCRPSSAAGDPIGDPSPAVRGKIGVSAVAFSQDRESNSAVVSLVETTRRHGEDNNRLLGSPMHPKAIARQLGGVRRRPAALSCGRTSVEVGERSSSYPAAVLASGPMLIDQPNPSGSTWVNTDDDITMHLSSEPDPHDDAAVLVVQLDSHDVETSTGPVSRGVLDNQTLSVRRRSSQERPENRHDGSNR
jgi:hypothetical protein